MNIDNYNEFCKTRDCEHYIEWSFEYGNCVSCKLVGQSYNIEEYPENCPHIDGIRQLNAKNKKPKEQE